jgi:hypothetical protein
MLGWWGGAILPTWDNIIFEAHLTFLRDLMKHHLALLLVLVLMAGCSSAPSRRRMTLHDRI